MAIHPLNMKDATGMAIEDTPKTNPVTGFFEKMRLENPEHVHYMSYAPTGSISEIADWPTTEEANSLTNTIDQALAEYNHFDYGKEADTTAIAIVDKATKNILSEQLYAGVSQLDIMRMDCIAGLAKDLKREPTQEECKEAITELYRKIDEAKRMGDSGLNYESIRPRPSRSQIGQALACKRRAEKAGRKLEKKQKAERNRCRQA